MLSFAKWQSLQRMKRLFWVGSCFCTIIIKMQFIPCGQANVCVTVSLQSLKQVFPIIAFCPRGPGDRHCQTSNLAEKKHLSPVSISFHFSSPYFCLPCSRLYFCMSSRRCQSWHIHSSPVRLNVFFKWNVTFPTALWRHFLGSHPTLYF